MIFDLIKHAKQLLFNDSIAKTGSGNVQGAIESVQNNVNTVKTKVNSVAGEVDYYNATGQIDYLNFVNNKAQYSKITINEDGSSNTSVGDVIKGHDLVLGNLRSSLYNLVYEEKKYPNGFTVNSYAGLDFTVNIAKDGYVCIGANIRSTGNYNVAVVGGGLTDLNTFTGTVRNITGSNVYSQPIISCVYLRIV